MAANDKPIVRFFIPAGKGNYINMDELPAEEKEALADQLGNRLAEAFKTAFAARMLS